MVFFNKFIKNFATCVVIAIILVSGVLVSGGVALLPILVSIFYGFDWMTEGSIPPWLVILSFTWIFLSLISIIALFSTSAEMMETK